MIYPVINIPTDVAKEEVISNLTNASFFAPFFINPLVSVLPRLFFPVAVHLIAKGLDRLLSRFSFGKSMTYILSSALGTGLHTTMVMGMIYLLYSPKIADMLISGVGAPQALVERGVGVGIAVLGLTNGLPEMLVAALIAPVVALALDKVMSRTRARR